MNQWLQNYPFRIPLSWWIFLVGGLSHSYALTVGFQAVKAAMSNRLTASVLNEIGRFHHL
jgi:putative ABC transport system permease protein